MHRGLRRARSEAYPARAPALKLLLLSRDSLVNFSFNFNDVDTELLIFNVHVHIYIRGARAVLTVKLDQTRAARV